MYRAEADREKKRDSGSKIKMTNEENFSDKKGE